MQAIYDLRVLSGDPVRVSVVAVHAGADPLAAAARALPSDGYRRRGEFSLAGVAPVRLRFTVGDPCDADHACAPFSAGMASFAELHGGRPLGGEYGVLRPVELTMANPTSAPRDVFLYEQAGTAGVTTTLAFDGDDAPTEVPCLADLDGHYLVKRFSLGPGERRVVTGAFLTDGGSHFPLELGLTAIPPALPADQCAAAPASLGGPGGVRLMCPVPRVNLILVLAVGLGWGLLAPASKALYAGEPGVFDGMTVALARALWALPLFLIGLGVAWRLDPPRLDARRWGCVVAAGLIFGLLISTLFTVAAEHTSVAHISFLVGISPVTTAAIAALVFRTGLDQRARLALGLGVLGVVLLALTQRSDAAGIFGDVLMVGWLACFGAYGCLLRAVGPASPRPC